MYKVLKLWFITCFQYTLPIRFYDSFFFSTLLNFIPCKCGRLPMLWVLRKDLTPNFTSAVYLTQPDCEIIFPDQFNQNGRGRIFRIRSENRSIKSIHHRNYISIRGSVTRVLEVVTPDTPNRV